MRYKIKPEKGSNIVWKTYSRLKDRAGLFDGCIPENSLWV